MNTHVETESELDERTDAEAMALDKAMVTVALKTRNSPFADRVKELKAVEAEFVMRAGDDDFLAVETKRRVAESIFRLAVEDDQPFETSRDIWNDLLRLGFSDLDITCRMTWYFGWCCEMNKQPEPGLAALEPLMAELERLLAAPTATRADVRLCRRHINLLERLSAKLKRLRGQDVEIPPDIPEVALSIARSRARDALRKSPFADHVQTYKAIEAEFLLRGGGDAEFALETRLFVLESILRAAYKTAQPFDTCRDIWNEVRSLGFGDSGMEYMMTTLYIECCLQHEEAEAGIAVLEPIIAKTKQLLADPTVKKAWKRSYRDDLRMFEQFLDEMKGMRGKT